MDCGRPYGTEGYRERRPGHGPRSRCRARLWRNLAADARGPGRRSARLGRPGEITPLVPVRIMPAQGSVTATSLLWHFRAAAGAEEFHERQRPVLRPRRARRRRLCRAAAQIAQDLRRGLARPTSACRCARSRRATRRELRRREESSASSSTTRPAPTPTRRRRSTSAAAWPRCARRGSPSAATPSNSTAPRPATARRAWPTRSSPASAST